MTAIQLHEKYDDHFYDIQTPLSISSATEIIPIIIELVNPKSVIDIGCGTGAWLKVWEKFGVTDIKGIDGDYINPIKLLIDKNKFFRMNLEDGIHDNRKFDIVSCLEVVEHLSKESAGKIVDSLCNLGNIILFSAAIPGQEGTHHINEQYPSYWRTLFGKNDFVPIDCVRRKVWTNKNVAWWYKQNIMLYVHQDYLNESNELKSKVDSSDIDFIDIVHPEYFNYKSNKANYYENLWKNATYENNDIICKLYLKIKRKLRLLINFRKK